MSALEAAVETIREIRQEVVPYLDFATQVSVLAVRLAEEGNPAALDLLRLLVDLNARVDEFDLDAAERSERGATS